MYFKKERFTFTQSIASTTWTINHNLGRIPVISVWVDNKIIVPKQTQFVDNNTIIISFSAPKAGAVVLS